MNQKSLYRIPRPGFSHSTAALLLCLSILAGLVGPVYSWNEKTHKDQLTKAALELVLEETENQEYSSEIWNEFSKFIMQGAHDEDFPCDKFAYREAPEWFRKQTGLDRAASIRFDLRANNHYSHGIVPGVGLTYSALPMGDPDTDALNWAKTNLPFNFEEEFKDGIFWHPFGWTSKDLDGGNMSWWNAIDRYGYTQDSKQLAYYTLGFILHLLQDMGEPEHVHDDPHGGSSFIGFERYIEDHWLSVKPEIRSLRPWRLEAGQPHQPGEPAEAVSDGTDSFLLLKEKKKPETDEEKGRRFADINEYFMRLGKIAYSATRFKGFLGNRPADPAKIEKGSDLEQMFDIEEVEYRPAEKGTDMPIEHAWVLRNKRRPVSGGLNYLPEVYGSNPVGHKGRDAGDWWPTSRELENVGKYNVDAEGYYYIELSPDIPFQEPGKIIYNFDFKKGFGKRDLYPMAYLPTPLPEVEQACSGWRKHGLNGETHLYEILAKNLAPHVVQASAGLIQHYFDIVNHPPYVNQVSVLQNGERYKFYWHDALFETTPGTGGVKDLKKRELVPDKDEPLQPGKAQILIFFSEPVAIPAVMVGDIKVKDLKLFDEATNCWSGFFEIPPDEERKYDRLKISIEATDLNRHYGDEGARLDAHPETPAKRRVWKDGYRWLGYLPGRDENHSIRIVRYPTEIKIRSVKPIVFNLAELSIRESEDGRRGYASHPQKIRAGETVRLDIEMVAFSPPGKAVEITVQPSLIGWARFSGKTPQPLRLEPFKRTVLFGQGEAEKTERATLTFAILYPTNDETVNTQHDLCLELAVNGKPQKPLIIADAFDVSVPGTDYNGTGDLSVRIRLPGKDVNREAVTEKFYRGEVKVSLYPISGLVAPAPKISSGAIDFPKIPLGRYRVVAQVQDDRYYKGPSIGSTVVTLFKWNPQDRHAGSWHAWIELGKSDEEKKPDFVEQSKSNRTNASIPKEWYVHVKILDQYRQGISGAKVFTVEGHMEAKDQGRGEYLLGPIKNVDNSTMKDLKLKADIHSQVSPDILVWLSDKSRVHVEYQFVVSYPPAFVRDSKTQKTQPPGTVTTQTTPAGQSPGSDATTPRRAASSDKRKDRCECIRIFCPLCKNLLFCTSNDPDCLACIDANEEAIRQCMEE